MPALNTPQFGWVKSRLPRKAQPVPPIFNRRWRREPSTMQPIIPAPRVLRWLIHGESHRRQQAIPTVQNNLWKPLVGDHGAHGTFDDIAKSSSVELWATTHAKWLALAAGLMTLCALATPRLAKPVKKWWQASQQRAA